MEPTRELVDDIFRGKVRRARLDTPEGRFRAGPELFEMACEWSKAGIRMQHPGLDEAGVMEELKRRLALCRKLGALPRKGLTGHDAALAVIVR